MGLSEISSYSRSLAHDHKANFGRVFLKVQVSSYSEYLRAAQDINSRSVGRGIHEAFEKDLLDCETLVFEYDPVQRQLPTELENSCRP